MADGTDSEPRYTQVTRVISQGPKVVIEMIDQFGNPAKLLLDDQMAHNLGKDIREQTRID